MSPRTLTEVAMSVLSLYDDFTKHISVHPTSVPSTAVQQWRTIERDIQEMRESGTSHDEETRTVVGLVAMTTATHAQAMLDLQRNFGILELDLVNDLDQLFDSSRDDRRPIIKRKSDRKGCIPDLRKRTCRRSPSPPTHRPPSPPNPPLTTTTTTSSPPTIDPIRQFFLTHLSHPYPTASQKLALATKTGLSKKKVEGDLTNWRRRSKWTDIKDRRCSGDMARMKKLVERVIDGKEKNKEVREEVEGMVAYIKRTKEEEKTKVGEWVHEIAQLAWEGKLNGQPKAQPAAPEPTFGSSGTLTEEPEEGYESDAEGETESSSDSDNEDDDLSHRMASQPQPQAELSTVPTTPEKYTPSSVIDITPPQAFDPVAPAYDPAQFQTITCQPSISSMSAASAQMLISHGSHTPSLRSVSGSSNSSAQHVELQTPVEVEDQPIVHNHKLRGRKRQPAPQLLPNRSSRARLEEVMGGSEVEPQWTGVWQPSQRFHMGTTAPVVPATTNQAYSHMPYSTFSAPGQIYYPHTAPGTVMYNPQTQMYFTTPMAPAPMAATNIAAWGQGELLTVPQGMYVQPGGAGMFVMPSQWTFNPVLPMQSGERQQ